jgi:tetratricopeptide (TPR) repeat protein
VALLRGVLEADPDHREGLDLLGFALFFAGRSAEAEPFCRHAVEKHPEHAYAWKGLGLHLIALGQRDEGFAAVERACTLKPGWFDPHWDYLVSARAAGDRARFERMRPLAEARFPAQAEMLRALADGARWT